MTHCNLQLRFAWRFVLVALLVGSVHVTSPAPVVAAQVGAPVRSDNQFIDSILATLTPREKIGQLIMPWLSGAYTSTDAEAFDRASEWIEQHHIGGIVVSVGSPLDAAAKLNALQQRSKLPLIVAADLEYGAAMRMVGATAFPQPMAFGATGRELDAYQLGRVTAVEARAVGIHWTFSPVADVNNNPNNPIINTRSFGESPEDVARLLTAYIRGAADHGLYTTAKHFPGHGDTDTDSHISLPTVTGCWDRLQSVEFVPFRAAIRAGVTSVMTAHVRMQCFDGRENLPATLSPTVMTGFLKDSLGFNGLVVTDALSMGAIVERFGAGETAVRAFRAGSDLLLMPADIGQAVGAMLDALAEGTISPARLDASVRRVLRLKVGAGLFQQRTVALDAIPAIIGQRSHQAIADDIALRSLTLVQIGPIEDMRARRGRTAVIAFGPQSDTRLGNDLLAELRTLGEQSTLFRLYPNSGKESYDSTRADIRRADRVIFAASVKPTAGRGNVSLADRYVQLIRDTERAASVILVSFGNPYLLNQARGYNGGYILAWHNVPASERAVARALTGQEHFSGTLPVTLSDTFPRGFGLSLPRR